MNQPPPLPDDNPYATPVARVEDRYQGDHLVLADRGIRLVAKIVDWIIVFGALMVVAVIAAIALPALENNQGAKIFVGVLVGIGFVAMLALWIVNLVMLHRHGQTIAKRMFNIKIVRTDGGHCSLARIIFARWLPVALLGAIPLLGYVFALLDPLLIFRQDQRCLHDLIADTIVVKA